MWECSKGHQFEKSWIDVQTRRWCKLCSKRNVQPKIDKFCIDNNILLLDPYQNAKIKMNWQCIHCNLIIIRTWDVMSRTSFVCKCKKS